MKALKRKYSILNLDNKHKMIRDKLIDYFNSPIGLLNRCKSDLETMLLVIESPKFDIDEIRNSLQMLKEIISAFPVENNLEVSHDAVAVGEEQLVSCAAEQSKYCSICTVTLCNRKSLSIKPRKTRIKFQLKVLIKSNKSLLKYLFVNFV